MSNHNSRVLILLAEHMEEDDETSKSIPKWVELEYSVSGSTRTVCMAYSFLTF